MSCPGRRPRRPWRRLLPALACLACLGAEGASAGEVHLADQGRPRGERGELIDRGPLGDLALPGPPGLVQFGGPMAALTWHPHQPLLYAGMGARLAVIAAIDPAQPQLLGQLPLGQPATALQVVDGAAGSPPLLLAAAGTAGVAVFSLAQPQEPLLLAWVDTDWFAYDLAYWRWEDPAGGEGQTRARLLVADGGAGLALFDLGDPAAPRRLSTLDTPSEARALAVDPSAGRAYVADWGRGLVIVGLDVADGLRLLGQLDSPGEAVDLAIEADGARTWVYLADREGGLSLVEAGDAAAPQLAERWGSAEVGRVEGVALTARALYLADGQGFLRYLEHPGPGRLGGIGSPLDVGGLPAALALAGQGGSGAFLAIANSRLGLQLVGGQDAEGPGGDPATDQAPALEGSLLSPSFVEGVAWEPRQRLAYLADAYAGLLVVGLPAGRPPRVLGRLATGVATHDVALWGRRAFLADAGAGLRAVDIGDPTQPRDLGLADSPGEALGLALDPARGLAFLADGPGGLSVFDISGAAAPRLVATLPAEGYAWSLRLDAAAGLIYLADRQRGLRVIDVAQPEAPRHLALYGEAGGLFELALDGSRAFAGAGAGGLWLLDLSRPAAPRAIGRASGGPAQGLALLDDRLYVTAGATGLRRYARGAGPGLPQVLADWPLEGLTERIDGALGPTGRILVACEWGGLAVLAPEDRLRDAILLPSLTAPLLDGHRP